MTQKEKRQYQVKEKQCYNKKCFTPFSGNGIKICRLYELGKCPIDMKNKNVKKDKKLFSTNMTLSEEI